MKEKIMPRNVYYNRLMVPELETLIKQEYQWLIDYVKNRPELDFQTGKNASHSWFSVYRGTGRLFTIKMSAKRPANITIFADNAYMELCEELYKNPSKANFEKLLEHVTSDTKFDRYYQTSNDDKKEGFYQNLISRRYTLELMDNDDMIVMDKEFVWGYESEEVRDNVQRDINHKYDTLVSGLSKRDGFPSNIKTPGNECDFVCLNKKGELILMELKRKEDTQKIYLSPIQIGKYADLYNVNSVMCENFYMDICAMINQKIRLGLIKKPSWELPRKIESLKLYLVVGGKPTEVAKNNYKIVLGEVTKVNPLIKIETYSCDTDGTLIKLW